MKKNFIELCAEEFSKTGEKIKQAALSAKDVKIAMQSLSKTSTLRKYSQDNRVCDHTSGYYVDFNLRKCNRCDTIL